MRFALPFLCVAALTAQTPEIASPRIAFFIPDKVFSTSVRAKKVLAEMEVTGKNLSDRLKVKQDELTKIDSQLKSPGLSDEGRAKLQRDLQDGDTLLRRMQEDSQREFQKVREKCMGQFQTEVGPIIETLAKEWKLQVVMNYTEGMISWVDEPSFVAFSSEISKRYDAKYEGGAAPAPKPPAAPAKPPVKK
jgi:Skp family chaperone for outer membrane proteins